MVQLLKVVNNLGYPHPFKLSHLQTMTSDKWPTMLSVLDWLIDIIEVFKTKNLGNLNFRSSKI